MFTLTLTHKNMFKENQSNPTDTNTIIGASVSVEGDFNGQGDVLIEGKLKGSIKTGQHIQIGKNALVEAEIKAASAHISGAVKGNIAAKEKIELTKSARVEGNLTGAIISIEPGAVFNGQCTMNAADSNKETEGEISKKEEK